VGPACRTNNSVVLVVPNVQVRLEAQHSIHHVGLHDLLRESFTFSEMSSHTGRRLY